MLETLLRSNGLGSAKVDVTTDSSRPRTVLTSAYGGGKRTLYLHGHYDVVPAFSSAQFQPRVSGDVVFGRGASDMKSGLVAMIFALKALKDLAVPMGGRVALVFVPDEETGGACGSAALAARGLLGLDAVGMLLPEPTSGVAWTSHRGALTLEVTVKGRAAHVGLAHQGVNALERALPLVQELFSLKSQIEGRSVLLIGGLVKAGANFNVVPDTCTFTIDRRFNPDEDRHAERQRLFDIIERSRAQGLDVDVIVVQDASSTSTPSNSELAMALAQAIHAVTGRHANFEMCPGLLELRFYAERGVPA